MTGRHEDWRSPGNPALAAAPWIVIVSGFVGLLVLLVMTLWSSLNPWSSGSPEPGKAASFPPVVADTAAASSPALPATDDTGADTPVAPVPGQGGDAPARTTTTGTAAAGSSTPAAGPTATKPSASPARTTQPAAARDAFAAIQAESFDARSGVTIETSGEGGRAIGKIADGDWARYDDVDFGSSAPTGFVARVASGLSGGGSGLVRVRLDSPTATPIGDFAIDNTGGWQSWRTVPGNVAGPTGRHTVYLTFTSAQPADFVAVNWFTFRT